MSMLVRTSFDQDDARLKAEVDALLDEDAGGPRSGPSRWPRLGVWLLLVLASTAAAHTLPRAAFQRRPAVLSLPIFHFGLLSLVGLAWLRLARAAPLSREVLELNRKTGLLAALCVASFLLSPWQATWIDSKVWAAVEVFIFPALILLTPLLLPPTKTTATTPHYTAILVAFLTGFSLLGVTPSGVGILIAIAKLPLEAARWCMLVQGFSSERPSSFLTSVSLLALLGSLAIILFSLLFPSPVDDVFNPIDVRYILEYSIAALVSQASLLAGLALFVSPLTVGATLLWRNCALMLLGTLSRGGQIRGGWMQVSFVYLGGALALAWTDDEMKGILSKGRASGLGADETVLPRRSPTSPRVSRSRSPSLSTRAATPPPYRLALLSFLSLLGYLIMSPSATTSVSSACSFLPANVAARLCNSNTVPSKPVTVDLVFSYYEEEIYGFRDHIEFIRENAFVKKQRTRVLVYNKGNSTEAELRSKLWLNKGDEIIKLPNVGREGATYLRHILSHYNSSIDALASAMSPSFARPTLRTSVLADHTFFLQPHLAWNWIAKARLEEIAPETGFVHLGPYIRNECGYDVKSNAGFALVRDIYEIFTGQICPPTGQLSAWSGQFVVSKRRILANAYHRYEALDQLIEAPSDHWVHKQVWAPNDSGGQSNPGFGHYVERAWPVIFGCTDPKIAEECSDDVSDKERCQCLDR